MYHVVRHRMLHAAEHRIMRLLDHRRLSFEELLQKTWGIYPVRLLALLNDLEKYGLIKKNNDKNYELTPQSKTHRQKKEIKEKGL